MVSPSDSNQDSKSRVGISLWISIGVFLCIWILTKFLTGRRQLRNNLSVIEHGLERMQMDIERRQKQEENKDLEGGSLNPDHGSKVKIQCN